jgi:methylated-DNA-[protein]-cysteine S-methyltransferase
MELRSDDPTLYGKIETPLGELFVGYNSKGIERIDFINKPLINFSVNIDNLHFIKCYHQLKEYFSGYRKEFGIQLNAQGTAFQKKVWTQLLTIPYGQTLSYQQIAIELGDPKMTRAVATAIAKNPILLLIPCHRVIGKNGKLTGFSGGLDRKRRLLQLENSQGLF